MPDSQPVTVVEVQPTITLVSSEIVPLAPLPNELPQVPGYQIVRLIGRGGMGVVYEARDLSLQRTVALKMILVGQHASEKDRARFKQEAEAVARLQHSGIVQIYEIGESVTGPFLALEYVAGGSLADKLDGKPWLAIQAAKLIEQVAVAVEAAHQVGIVHRDLKPANILLQVGSAQLSVGSHKKDTAPTGKETTDTIPGRLLTTNLALPTAKITDFGLAKRLDSDRGQTATGAILGTPSYMAPEQAESRRDKVGPPTDVYALGAILYELLTGRPPFLAETPFDTIMQVCKQEPVPPTRLNAKVPGDLETICLKCLRKEPERRYATAAELADDLRRYQEGRTILARPVGRIERGWRWCWRNPTVACLVASVATTLIAGTIIASYFAIHARNQSLDAQANAARAQKNADEAIEAKKQSEKNADEAIEAKKQSDRNLYAARLGLSQNALRDNRLIRLRELLQETEPVDGAEDYRGWEWYFLDRQTRMTQRSYALGELRGGRSMYGLALSPSSGRAAYLSLKEVANEAKNTIIVVELATAEILFTREIPSTGLDLLALSSDGRVIAWGEEKAVRVFSLASQKEILNYPVNEVDDLYSLALDGTGSRLAVASSGFVHIVSIEDGQTKKIDLGAGNTAIVMQFDWPGANLFIARNTPGQGSADGVVEVMRVDCKTGAVRPTIGPMRELQTNALFTLSADGRLLFIPTGKRSVAVWNVLLHKQIGTVAGVPDRLGSMAANHDGRLLALGRANGVVSIHDVQDEAATPIVLRGHDTPALWLTFLGSGKLCGIAGEGEVRHWSATPPEHARLINPSNSRTRSTAQPAFDAQGKQLAQLVVTASGPAGFNSLEAVIWDTTSQRVRLHRSLGVYLNELSSFGPPPGQVALSDDGKFFAVVVNRQQDVEAFKTAAGLLPNLALRLGGTSKPSNVPKVLLDAGIRQLTQEADVVRLYDVGKAKEVASIRLPESPQQLLLSPDGRYVLATGRSWHLFDAAGTRLAGPEITKTAPQNPLTDSGVARAVFHPDGQRFVVARTRFNANPLTSMTIRSLAEPDRAVEVPLDESEKGMTIRTLRFSPSGRHLAAVADAYGGIPMRSGQSKHRLVVWRMEDDGSVTRLWSAPHGSDMFELFATRALPLAFDEKAGRVAVGNLHRDQLAEIVVRNLEDGEPIKKFRLQSSGVQFTGFSADGKRLLVVVFTIAAEAHTAELHVFDLTSGQELLELPLGNVINFQGASYHFDGHKLRIAAWNDKTGEYRMLDGSPRVK